MNTFFDMASYAQKYMGPTIAKFGLTLARKSGDLAWLQNEHCTIRLENIDNDYVRFEFNSSSKPDELWEFADFLDCMNNGRGMQMRPLPPKDLANEAKFVFMLEKYNELMMAGYFDAPLAGDFSWEQQYRDMQAEYKRLATARFKLEKSGHPEAVGILRKKLDNDQTWMDDVRRILAEQESKS